MAKKAASSKSSKKSTKDSINKLNYEVFNVIEFKNGNVGFAMKLKDIPLTLYNLVVVSGKNKKGSYEFISFPSREGNDEKYYNYYYLPLSEKLQKEIIDEVYGMLDEDDDEDDDEDEDDE